MSLPVEEQLRAYFIDLDREQDAINIAAIAATESSAAGRLILDPGEPDTDRYLQVELDITPLEREETMKLKPSTVLLLAAAAIVLIAGLILAIDFGSDDSSPVISNEVPASTTPPPAAIPPTPQEIAEQFMDARDVWDAESVRALVADDASIDNDARVTSADG